MEIADTEVNSVFMLVTYIAVLLLFMYGVYRYVRAEKGFTAAISRGLKPASSRLIMLYKVVLILVRKPSVAIAVASIIVMILISARAADFTYLWMEVSASPPLKGNAALMVSFTGRVGEDLINNLTRELTSSGITQLSRELISRVILEEPMSLPNVTSAIHVVIGVDKGLGTKLGIKDGYVYVSCNALEGTASIGKYRVSCISPALIAGARVVNGVPLLPVQAYLGATPITPPPTSVIVTDIETAAEVLGTREVFTDVVYFVGKGVNTTLLFNIVESVASKYPAIAVARYVEGGKGYIFSKVTVPTGSSVIVALLASAVSAVLALSILSSLVPQLRRLYVRLSIQGMPPWGNTLIAVSLSAIVTAVPGLIALGAVFVTTGGSAAFNSLVTLAFTWIASTAYFVSRSRPKSLKTDVYVPVARRYTLAVPNCDIDSVREAVVRAIRGNEFFDAEELEYKYLGGEVLIHARMSYSEAWGSGLDVNVMVVGREGNAMVHITAYVWSVEEISEAIMSNMLALAISRIVGGVKAWCWSSRS